MAIVRKRNHQDNAATQGGSGRDLFSFVEEIKANGLYETPINVERLAEYLGLDVVQELMDDDISGYLEFRRGQWVAGLNALHHKTRQRFTLAHEMAHFVLHRSDHARFVDNTFTRREGNVDPTESEADRFAAELLMPADRVRGVVGDGVTNVRDLAHEFNVSLLAMRYRLKNLGFRVI